MLEWSRALRGIPILLHAADREWVLRTDPAIEYWDGETYALPGGLAMLRLGGHFAGGSVLHWPAGAQGLWWGRSIRADAKSVIRVSVERYVRALR